MVKISNARIDMEGARIDNALFKDYGEILVGGAAGANTGAVFSIDLSASNVFNIILNAAIVDLSFINAGPSGSMCSFTLFIQQDSVGSRKINWPTTVLWDGSVAPALTTTPNRLDIFSFMSADGGRKWYGFTSQQNSTAFNLTAVTMWAWGLNQQTLASGAPTGQLGTNDGLSRLIPSAVNSDSWSTLTAGTSFTLATKSDGTLWSWGSNGNYGMLGTNAGASAKTSSPVQIGTLTNWSMAGARGVHSLAINSSGNLFVWGLGTSGETGNNAILNRSSPVQVGTLTNWSSLGNSGNPSAFNAAFKTDGTLWTWGQNTAGELGDSTVISRSSPVQIGTLTNWTAQFTETSASMLAIKTDGTLWAWGQNQGNGQGMLGTNNLTQFSSPVQVGTLTNWAQVSAGRYATHAIKTDGTLWGWGGNNGTNTFGAVGNNTSTVAFSSPVQIGTLTSWSNIWSGTDHFIAQKTDGTLWGWGLNSSGQLGTGDTTNRSSPVQIGQITTWTIIAPGGNHTMGLKT